jgi:S1-C subfamily serine protease
VLKLILTSLVLNVVIATGVVLGYNFYSDYSDNNTKTTVYNSSVEIGKVTDKGEFDGFCSGTVVHAVEENGETTQHILTALHCVKNLPVGQKTYIQASTKDKQCPEPVVSIEPSLVSDLAILEVKSKNLCQASVAELAPRGRQLKFGDQVFVLGYPYGTTKTVTFGRAGEMEGVSEFRDVSKSTKFQRATPSIGPGTSGGGLFNLKGELVGTTTGGLSSQMGGMVGFINYFTPTNEVLDFIEEVSKDWKLH